MTEPRRKTVAEVAIAELWQLEKEQYAMSQQKQQQEQQQPQQQPQQPALAPVHQQALQAAGVDPARLQRLSLAQILALIQAILAAVGPIIGGGGAGGGGVPPS